MLLNTLEYFDNLLKQSNNSNDIDQIKNVFKLLSKKDDNKFDINENKFNKKIEINIKININLTMMKI